VLESVVSQFLFGLVGVLGGTALTSRTVATRLDGRVRDAAVAVVWLVPAIVPPYL